MGQIGTFASVSFTPTIPVQFCRRRSLISDTMPESEFRSRADALFKPLGLASVVGAVIDILSAATTKFGYFYNPHVVDTRLLDDSSFEMERFGKQLAAWESSSREAFFSWSNVP